MAIDHGGGRVEFSAAEAVPEQGTFPYAVSLFDDAGAPLLASAVATVTATLVAIQSGAVIFAARNVKNLNGGVLVDGAFSLVLSGTPHLALQVDERAQSFADRRLTITITAVGTSGAPLPILREVIFFVRNLAEVPTP